MRRRRQRYLDRRHPPSIGERLDRRRSRGRDYRHGGKESDLQSLVDEHCGIAAKPKHGIKVSVPTIVPKADKPTVEPTSARRRRTYNLSALHSGALLLTANKTKAALGIGHSKVYGLTNSGVLERGSLAAGTKITSASVRRLAGIAE